MSGTSLRISVALVGFSLAAMGACTSKPTKTETSRRSDSKEVVQADSARVDKPAENVAQAPGMDPAAAKPPVDGDAAAKPDPEAEKLEKEKKIAERLAKFNAKADQEQARWDDRLKAEAKKLANTNFRSTADALETILASAHRVPGNSERDVYRHPIETMTFFGLEPKHTVIEIGPGEGWYTELLAPLLAKSGKLVVISEEISEPIDSMSEVYAHRLKRFLAKSPELYGKVETRVIAPPEKVELGPPESADLVLAIREMHGWVGEDSLDPYVKAAFAVLKPGGRFGVVQHRAKPDADPKESAEKGYLPEAWLISQVEAAGFRLDEKSEINANPKDTKDYAQGVWTLPPNLAEGDKDRDKYMAIGESDRATLRFVKPKS